jgi:ADP-heptose:LPS heptosyltransferase
MNPWYYRDQWKQMLETQVDPIRLRQLCQQASYSFIDHSYYNDHYEKEYIDLLCEMATFSPDPHLTQPAAAALFGIIIEQLCDDYQDFQFDTYNRVMTQILSYCRTLPEGELLHEYLNENHITNQRELFDYAQRVHYKQYHFDPARPIQRIFVLSRITIGADVAIVSVMTQRLIKQFPQAEIIILGSDKLNEIFGGNPRVRVRRLGYERQGGLLQRLHTWIEVSDIIKEESASESPDQILIIDPDSRITQLGMLPLGEPQNYLYFNSHPESSTDPRASIAEITNQWLNEVFGPSDFCYPQVWLTSTVHRQVESFERSIRHSGCQRIVVVNLGVGGNDQKQLGLEFEIKLISRLLEDIHAVVVFDMGYGVEEWDRAQRILAEMQNQNIPMQQLGFEDIEQISIPHGILGVQSTIGQMAGLISCADEFIGYDSACQHIAAALRIPTLTIFAGTNNPRFIRRWSACGEGTTKIIHINSPLEMNSSMIEGIVERIMQERIAAIGSAPATVQRTIKSNIGEQTAADMKQRKHKRRDHTSQR